MLLFRKLRVPCQLQAPVRTTSVCRQPALCQAATASGAGSDGPPPGLLELVSRLQQAESLRKVGLQLSVEELISMLDEATSSIEVLDLAFKWADFSDSRHACLTLHCIAHRRPESLSPLLAHPGWQVLLKVVHSHVKHSDMAPAELADVAWVLGYLRVSQPEELVHDVLHAASARLIFFSCHELSKITLGVAMLETTCPALDMQCVLPRDFLEEVKGQLPVLLPQASYPFDITSFLWAYLTLGNMLPQEIMVLAGERLSALSELADQQDISTFQRAWAKFGCTLPS